MPAEPQPPHGHITILFTDIEDSTRMTRALGDSIYREEMREPHCAHIRTAITNHNGYEVKTVGDSFMVAFARADDAIACAADVQKLLSSPRINHKDSEGKEWTVRVRIGVHTAERQLFPDVRNDYNGNDVNYAARIESLGGGDQVIISNSTHRDVNESATT